MWQSTMYCHLKRPDTMPLITKNVFGAPGHPRPNVDCFIYIHYAVPPYSACISAIYHLPFGKLWLGSVCRVQRLAAKQNGEFTKGG